MLKRKTTDAHEKTRFHRERCRRAHKEHTRYEAVVNLSLGCVGWFVKQTAVVTHSDMQSAGSRSLISGKTTPREYHQ